MERAAALAACVEAQAAIHGSHQVRCRVAADLEAVEFWRAVEFEEGRRVRSTYLNRGPSASGRELIVFEKRLAGHLFGQLAVVSETDSRLGELRQV